MFSIQKPLLQVHISNSFIVPAISKITFHYMKHPVVILTKKSLQAALALNT